MPSPQVVAREPSRRVKKSRKPERRAKQPVDLGDVDMETPTPSQQSSNAGPGTGAGRERSRRVSERMPKAQGAKAHEKSRTGEMLDKGVGKRNAKQAKQRTSGRMSEGALAERELPAKQPRRQGAKKQSRAAKAKGNGANNNGSTKRAAPSAEAAPTQKQVLKDKATARRKLRNEGVDATQQN
jgi:hypothetical protein